MRYRTCTAVAATAIGIGALGAGAANADPVSVKLRVEGGARTIFEAPVTTDAHAVTTPSGGTHQCDGTNNAAPGPVGPTALTALDDGARLAGVSWDADWFPNFNDFIVKRVAGDAAQPWGFAVNYKFAEAGGCQTRVHDGDEVIWIYDAFTKSSVLRLAGPASGTTGRPLNVRVEDVQKGQPAAGATVNGATTGADGVATLSFPEKGVYRVKAERADAVRSNSIVLCVDPPDAEPCTSSDAAPPNVRVIVPGGIASEREDGRTLAISWQADDGQGSGVANYGVDVREVARSVRAAQDGTGWRTLLGRAPVSSVHYRGDSGTTYEFRVVAFDRAANRSEYSRATVSIPVDDRDRKLLKLSERGWRRVKRQGAWGRTVLVPRRRGATATLRFQGRRVALVGRRLPNAGRLKVTIDGRSRTFRPRGRSRPRKVIFRSGILKPGRHTVRVTALDVRRPVELDAVAPTP